MQLNYYKTKPQIKNCIVTTHKPQIISSNFIITIRFVNNKNLICNIIKKIDPSMQIPNNNESASKKYTSKFILKKLSYYEKSRIWK